MLTFPVLAYGSLFLALISILFAAGGSHSFYWLAAAGIYVFSFFAGFTIGMFTVPLAFVPLALAIGFAFKWIRRPWQYFLAAAAGLAIGICAVLLVGSWIFYPLFYFFLLQSL